jgi:branched-chain amino acid transport system ATP-binding protein
MGTELLTIQRLSKAFGGLQAIRDFDLRVEADEILGVIGPNGAGKTTLFNLVTGFLPPDAGAVCFRGESITRLKPFQIVNRGMARTFQLVDVFKELTVLENVLIPCFSHRARTRRHARRLPGRAPDSAERAAMQCLEAVGLAGRSQEKAKSLPFGELRLLDIARAMATQPDILLLDEPFSGLDAEDAAVLSTAIQQMHRKGQTMIIIEHRLRDLLKLVERVVAIVFGEKIAEGNPQEIMSNPKVVNAYLGERRD